MEQNATSPPKRQGDKARAKSRRERGFNTGSHAWWNPLDGFGSSIDIPKAGLWNCFFGSAIAAKKCIQYYLEHMENIRKVDPCISVLPTTLEIIDVSRPIAKQASDSSFCSTSFSGIEIDQERKMMKLYATIAVCHLDQMNDALNAIESLLKSPDAIFSPSAALWTVIFSISAATIPSKGAAMFASSCAASFAAELLLRPIGYWLDR
ncbi:hypothetical protein CDV36_005222 [Fusarium kuroshium]|uniref:Uncharacterized protein n=1 Tax=Fusarium kuroshium TaxID=2010991 RepID=A0A3M2SC14_9HYPO|nr:hypothetical protein CDV36_005222 [Fusarium kuroshium]